MRRIAGLCALLLVGFGCGSDDSAAEVTTTRAAQDGVNCEAASIVVLGNETLGAILEEGLAPIAASPDPVETQRLIESGIPPMAADLLELLPALNRAVEDLRASLPQEGRAAADEFSSFIQDYARSAASIRDVQGFEATLALENGAQSDAFDAALATLDRILREECGLTLVIDRPEPVEADTETSG